MPEVASRVHAVAGVFLSISVSAAVLACAIWNFQRHDQSDSMLYGAAVITGFLLNMGILVSLLYGASRHIPTLMTPYIVAASMHFFFSALMTAYFLICTAHGMVLGNDMVEVYGFLIFFMLSYFWAWSGRAIGEEREEVRRRAGKHTVFINENYI